MGLVDGLNHVATVTPDFDRFVEFYTSVFDGELVSDMYNEERKTRHGMVALGDSFVLHAFEMKGNKWTEPGQQMMDRGRIDHLAINATSMEAWETIRQRLIDAGASDGEPTDFGSALSVFFRDPDGMEAEVCIQTAPWVRTIDPND